MLTKLKQIKSQQGFFRHFVNTLWMFGEQILRMILGMLAGVCVAWYLRYDQFKPLLASDRNESLPPLVNISSGVNITTSVDITIKELAELLRSVDGYNGTLAFDSTKPDGSMCKLKNLVITKNH